MMMSRKSVVYFMLGISAGALAVVDFFRERPGMMLGSRVMLLILFSGFLYLSFKTMGKSAGGNPLTARPLLLMGIISVLTVVGIFFQMLLFW